MFKNFNNFKNKVALFNDEEKVKYSDILKYSIRLKKYLKNSLVLLVISILWKALKFIVHYYILMLQQLLLMKV